MALLALALMPPSAVTALAEIACKPTLSVKKIWEARIATAPLQPYRWTAAIVADTRHCATRSGPFEIDFIRIKEYAPDLQFTEKFRWSAGRFEVAVELTTDEAILEYRLGFIAPCVCRELPFDK